MESSPIPGLSHGCRTDRRVRCLLKALVGLPWRTKGIKGEDMPERPCPSFFSSPNIVDRSNGSRARRMTLPRVVRYCDDRTEERVTQPKRGKFGHLRCLSTLTWNTASAPAMTTSDVPLALPTIVAARLALFLSPLPSILQDDHQLTSPLTSFSRR